MRPLVGRLTVMEVGSCHARAASGEGDVSGVVTVDDEFDDQSCVGVSDSSDDDLDDEAGDAEEVELPEAPRGRLEGTRLGSAAILRR